jgi:four helix bundle protein
MKKVEHFYELEVYEYAQLFILTKTFPKEERYSLTDQMRRSSRSVGAHVAEGWGLRRYENHFVSKLSGADAERLETEHWIETARTCSYLTVEEARQLQQRCTSIGNMLDSMIRKSAWFCTPPPPKRK